MGSNIKIIEAEELLFDEVDTLVINSDKALLKLGWEPVVDIELMLEKVVGCKKYYKNDSEIFMINEINEYHTIISQQLTNFFSKFVNERLSSYIVVTIKRII